MIRSLFKGVSLLFGVCMLAGLVGVVMNPPPPVPVNKANPEEDEAGRDIMARAYAVGRSMSQAGAVKPSAAQVDAMSRRLQTAMGNKSSQRWFKQYFEAGFWEGWKGR